MTLAQAIKKFEGFLIGTKHREHTIACYRSDLATFEQFLKDLAPKKLLSVAHLNAKDLDRYSEYLRAKGFKTNTCRRKLLTVRRIFRFLYSRKKLSLNVASRLPAPHKLEKTPKTIDCNELRAKVQAVSPTVPLGLRNRLMLATLLETGCLVSELIKLRWPDVEARHLTLRGIYAERKIEISETLSELFADWKAVSKGDQGPVFSGFNRHGPLHERVTARGVENVIRGFGDVTPRVIRSSVILRWLREKVPRDEIVRRLGLKTPGVFRVYEPLLETQTELA